MTAVTGLEQAMTDTLLTLLPGSIRDRAGNVTLRLGSGTPRRLIACALDEVGYVVGNITDDKINQATAPYLSNVPVVDPTPAPPKP